LPKAANIFPYFFIDLAGVAGLDRLDRVLRRLDSLVLAPEIRWFRPAILIRIETLESFPHPEVHVRALGESLIHDDFALTHLFIGLGTT
jgi:hypothetical protein